MEEDQFDQSDQIPLNGTHNVETTKGDAEDFDFIRLSFTDSPNGSDKPKFFDTYEMPEFGIYNMVDKQSPREATDPPKNNGSIIKVNGASSELEANINGGSSIKINGATEPNGALVQANNTREEMPSTAVKKRWIRGRLVEVEEGV